MILLVGLAIFGASFGAFARFLHRSERSPERCLEHVDGFISALEYRLGDPGRPVPLHVQDQISAAMSDVTAALQQGRFTVARAIAHSNRHLALDHPPVWA